LRNVSCVYTFLQSLLKKLLISFWHKHISEPICVKWGMNRNLDSWLSTQHSSQH